MPPAAQRVAHTSPSAEPHGPAHDPPASHRLGETTASAARRVSSEQIELLNQLLARLRFARDANDPASMLGLLDVIDNETGILELVIQRADELGSASSTDDPLGHARVVARTVRTLASTARAQAEGMNAAETGAVSRLGSVPAPTSIEETRRRARDNAAPGVCDDPAMLEHKAVVCALGTTTRDDA